MRAGYPVLVLAFAATMVASAALGGAVGDTCIPQASRAYKERVSAALRSGSDLWGDELVRAPNGPSYATIARRLAPLFYARGPNGRRLTRSGAYYLPFAIPQGDAGAQHAMLHVADGSELLAGRVTGPAIGIFVGTGGRERFGSCLTGLAPPRLAEGWLPILRSRYRDAAGGIYDQESFTALVDGRPASFVRLTGTARDAVRMRVGPLSLSVPSGATRTFHVRWAPPAAPEIVDAARYEQARSSVETYWRDRLGEGAQIEVPERRVQNALRALLAQGLVMTWRYSIGNAYEQFSFPETVDVARVLGEYGFGAVERASLLAALPRRPTPYPSWKMGEKLLGFGSYHELYRDQATLDEVTPTLRGFVSELERQLEPIGLLARERYSSDIPDHVYGLHAQSSAWQGLRTIAAAWADAGEVALAARARRLAARLEEGIRAAVRRSERPLPDGSLFLPMRLLDDEAPYRTVTESRSGSYWNLVAPYALASGIFESDSGEAQGAFRYLLGHGARFLGLVRTAAYVLYGEDGGGTVSGVNPVYGNNASRFLAALDVPDRLVLGMYGQLAAGMTRGTFVAGEGTTIAPLDGAYYRTTYLPPNAAANASFLENLRLMLVHERDGALELAFATPRGWLEPGRRLAVRGVPTRFGPVSYTIDAGDRSLSVRVEVPSRAPPEELRLRLRLPDGQRIGAVTPRLPVDPHAETIDLTGLRGTVELEVRRSG